MGGRERGCSMQRGVLCFIAAAMAVLACEGDGAVGSGSTGPAADISDGNHRANCATPINTCVPSNPHFYFLPPMVKTPSFSGTFNPSLVPTVTICALALDGSQACDATQPVINPGPVQVDAADQQYQVNWRTDPTTVFVGETYRVMAFAGSRELGFADVVPVDNGSGFQDPATGDTIWLVDGSTLPIKFRIEVGALCGSDADCGEATIGPAGGTVITNTPLAGAFFPEGALTQNETVVIQPSATVPCIPVNLLQRAGCYTFRTDPGPTTFQVPVVVGMCAEVDGLTLDQIRALLLYKADPAPGDPLSEIVTPLQNAPASFLSCTNGLGLKPRSVWDRLAELLLPKPLFATHLGMGGDTDSFSRIAWGLPPLMIKVSLTDNQSALVGSAVPNAPAVTLVNPIDQTPVAGLPVTFTVGAGSGSVGGRSSIEVRSGPAGVAAVPWTLGQPGTNTPPVSEIGASRRPQGFTATGLSPPTPPPQ